MLLNAGLALGLFKSQRLSQEAIKTLRDSIASRCGELAGLGFLRERYSKASKIPDKQPIKFIAEFLAYIGLDVETKQVRKDDRERQLDISMPIAMLSRLSLDARTDKEVLRDKAMELKTEGLSLSRIGDVMNKTKRQVQELLKN